MTKIVKRRVNKGVKCYEIKWNNYEKTTIEPQIAVKKRYPNEVMNYEDVYTQLFTKKTKKKSK